MRRQGIFWRDLWALGSGSILITTHNEVCSPALKIPPSTQSPIMVSYKNNIETKLTVLQEINDLFIGYIAAQPQATPQSYNAIDMTFNGYNWTYKFTNDSSMDMVPCQGNCMGPCTSQCSLSQDCCCCDPNMMAQNQMAPAPAYPPVSQGISFSRIRLNGPNMSVQHLAAWCWVRLNETKSLTHLNLIQRALCKSHLRGTKLPCSVESKGSTRTRRSKGFLHFKWNFSLFIFSQWLLLSNMAVLYHAID